MANEADTKVVQYGDSTAFFLPAMVRKDSTYPFTEKQEKNLILVIGKGKIIIKAKKPKTKKGDGKNGR